MKPQCSYIIIILYRMCIITYNSMLLSVSVHLHMLCCIHILFFLLCISFRKKKLFLNMCIVFMDIHSCRSNP